MGKPHGIFHQRFFGNGMGKRLKRIGRALPPHRLLLIGFAGLLGWLVTQPYREFSNEFKGFPSSEMMGLHERSLKILEPLYQEARAHIQDFDSKMEAILTPIRKQIGNEPIILRTDERSTQVQFKTSDGKIREGTDEEFESLRNGWLQRYEKALKQPEIQKKLGAINRQITLQDRAKWNKSINRFNHKRAEWIQTKIRVENRSQALREAHGQAAETALKGTGIIGLGLVARRLHRKNRK